MPFAAIYVPDFLVAAVVRFDPELRGQAVVILEGTPPVATVAAMNEAATEVGIELGMTRLQASAYPVGLRQRSFEQEAAAHAALLDCAQAFSPRVEDTAPDTLVLDISGLERLFGPQIKLANDLKQRASVLGLETNIAVAANPDAAIHAARGFAGVTVIARGKQAALLGKLPIDVLQAAPEILETLDRWGIRNCHSLAVLPEAAIVERLGQEGLRLQKLARGAAERPLVPAEPPLKFEETMELEHPVALLEPLAFILGRLLEQLCTRLEARALATNELRLALELDISASETGDAPQRHGDTEEMNQVTSVSPCLPGEKGLHERALRLPLPMLDARLFLKLLQLDLRAHPPGAPVIKVMLAAEPVDPRPGQEGLFLPATPAPDRLELTLARVAGIVGEQKIGAAELLDTHRPDAFRITRFAPAAPQALKPSSASNANAGPKACSTLPTMALRRFRPPLAATVEVHEGEPVRISTAKICGEVASLSGPWRTSGEWWKNEEKKTQRSGTDAHGSNWAREEWDVAISSQGVALYRIFRELQSGAWFVEGTYD